MRLRIVISLLTGALVASTAAFALAAGPAPQITGGVLGSGTLIGSSNATVHVSHANGFVMENGNFPPGATAGWHSHRTALVGVVTAGTITLLVWFAAASLVKAVLFITCRYQSLPPSEISMAAATA